jgi:hypothetical protein
MSVKLFTPADVKGPKPGFQVIGPDFYRCVNTGTAPAIYRAKHTKLWIVCEAELDLQEALDFFKAHSNKRVQKMASKHSAYGFKTRKPAVTKFVKICNSRLQESEYHRQQHARFSDAARNGDVGAALAAGDY